MSKTFFFCTLCYQFLNTILKSFLQIFILKEKNQLKFFLKVAMEQVLKDKEAGGHLIIITKETENSLTSIQEQNIETVISNFGVRVSSIVLAGQRQNQFYETIAASSGGVYKRISGTSNLMEMYSDFIEAMRDVVAKDTKVNFSRISQ